MLSKLPFMMILLAVLPLSAWSEQGLDFTALSLEQLSDTEVISTSDFAQQVVDAPSAVSVVTAVEIERFGYRTIAEILNSMRGLHISQDRNYAYLGGRGYSANDYAGRIMILIDGYAAADNYFNQIYIGNDGYLDTALIERVEYAPGPGSAIYGNNAFLGVVNIITRKGRDFQGFDTTVTRGSHGEQDGRVTWGKRFDNGAEWLLSASQYSNEGVERYYDGEVNPNSGSHAERLFLKGRYQGWSWLASSVDHWRDNTLFGDAYRWRDRNSFLNVGYETALGTDLQITARAYSGNFKFDGRSTGPYGTYLDGVDGQWYGLDSKVIYLGLEGHQIIFGGEYRVDERQNRGTQIYDYEDLLVYQDEYQHSSNTLSVYAEDSITLSPSWRANIGGRFDRREYLFDNDLLLEDTVHSSFNPRFALSFAPTARTTLKLSYGQASRFIPTSEFYDEVFQPSRARTTELVVEHQARDHRLLGSWYQYRVDQLPLAELFGVHRHVIEGLELESEWQWQGGRMLRISYALQDAKDDQGEVLANVPRSIGKLNFSTPLLGADERLRASLALRYIGTNHNLYGESLKGYTLADLTLTSSQLLPGTTLTLGVRNLFDKRYGHVSNSAMTETGLLPQDGRSIWLQLRYRL